MRDVWYPKNRQKHLGYLSNLKRKILAYINLVKSEGACSDCGYLGKNYPQVLDFDHRKDKKFNIGNCLSHTTSLKRVIEEIAKCDLVCANCHRIRTAKKRSYTLSKIK